MTRQLILMKSISMLKHKYTFYTSRDKLDHLLNWSRQDHLPSQGGLRDWTASNYQIGKTLLHLSHSQFYLKSPIFITFPKSSQITSSELKVNGFKKPKSQVRLWATFVRKFAAKNFKESPNLVTLSPCLLKQTIRKLKQYFKA